MNRNDFRKIVNDSVTQSLAQQGSGATYLPADQLQAIVDGIADGVFAGLEATLEDDGVIDSIDLTHPGVLEAAQRAAAAAAKSATEAALEMQSQTPSVMTSPTPVAQPSATEAATAVQDASQVESRPVTAPRVQSNTPQRLTSNVSPNVAPPVPPQAQAAIATAPAGGSAGEVLLWRGRPYMTIGTVYELTTQRLRVIRGIAGQTIEEVELVRVRDTSVKQSIVERLFHIGDIEIVSTDARQPTKRFFNVRDPIEVRELIRKAVVDERARRNVIYREEMHGNEEIHDMSGESFHP